MNIQVRGIAPSGQSKGVVWSPSRAPLQLCRFPAQLRRASLSQSKRLLVGSNPATVGHSRAAARRPVLVNRAELGKAYPSEFQAIAHEVKDALRGTSLYLVGLMGSGKSTVGKMLGEALEYTFFDTDALIEQSAGSTIPEIFASEGEETFREVETLVLQELAPFKECVVATGGGIVLRSLNWGYMQHGIVIWLYGTPQLLAERVVKDGTENRPLLSQGEAQPQQQSDELTAAVQRLTKLLEDRRKHYQFADIVVPLEGDKGNMSGAPAEVIAYRVLDAVRKRIKDDSSLREGKRKFTVKNQENVPTVKKLYSPFSKDGLRVP